MKAAAIVLSTFAVFAAADGDDGTCWLRSYGRGVGGPIHTCADGLQQDGLLCYPQCNDGYTGVGPVCWQGCPDAFRDDGAFCYKPDSYGRGAGYAIWSEDDCNDDNSQGCEKWGLMWYPRCNDNFHNVACCVCSPDCPSGMTDIGISCAKDSYGRGAGDVLTCADDEDEDAGLCYTPCNDGFHGVGPVCWASCPDGLDSCGALCVPSGQCSSDILSLGQQALEGVAKVAGDAGTDNVAGAVQNSAETLAQLAGGLIHPLCN